MIQEIIDSTTHPLNLVLMGPQGSGKGTQADLLSARFRIPIIATGQLIRNEIKNGTELGKKVEDDHRKGLLISDEVINSIVENGLKSLDCRRGFILDGYPRTVEQAQSLEKIVNLLAVFEIHISNKESIRRLADRRVCNTCGTNYNLDTNRPATEGICDKCGGQLAHRADDQPEAIKKRLELYHKETEIILDFYDSRGLLMKVYGEQPIQKVFNNIVEKLKRVMLKVPDY